MSDSLFRGGFSNPVVARQFLSAWLPPELVRRLHWETLELRRVAGINDALTERREDLVLRVRGDGLHIHLYLLLEHQSVPDPTMAQRVMEYQILIWQQHRSETEGSASRKLPWVIPIVIHPGPGKWGPVRRLRDLVDIPEALADWATSFVPDCGFLVVDLAGVPHEALANGPMARALLAAMCESRRGPMGFEQVRRIVSEHFSDSEQEVAARIAGILWTFLLGASELRAEEVRCIVEETIPEEQQDEFMSTADMLREEGRKEGLSQGLAKGLLQSILDALEAKFDTVPKGLVEKLERIDSPERLRDLLRTALRCADLEEFSALL